MNATGRVKSPSSINVPPKTSMIPAASRSGGNLPAGPGMPPNQPNSFMPPGQMNSNPATILSSECVGPANRFIMPALQDRDLGQPIGLKPAVRSTHLPFPGSPCEEDASPGPNLSSLRSTVSVIPSLSSLSSPRSPPCHPERSEGSALSVQARPSSSGQALSGPSSEASAKEEAKDLLS